MTLGEKEFSNLTLRYMDEDDGISLQTEQGHVIMSITGEGGLHIPAPLIGKLQHHLNSSA